MDLHTKGCRLESHRGKALRVTSLKHSTPDRVHYTITKIQVCQKFLINTVKRHLTHEICRRKFGRVKGALVYTALHCTTLAGQSEGIADCGGWLIEISI